ncbi:chaperonin GroEL [Kribbella qitaiheensis]|uniref:60 kDa chaperonin n=1 Tax=Kribbella qitaiheensis TaxID=1544730 RepID=A0A7G6X336_9ACTN|nr:TCP-1/cpn60 chaperonin family protein [Kribbella qitaiheensis]QNE20651.1 chaperonin GroEL [Kribbella qitaiheensis]
MAGIGRPDGENVRAQLIDEAVARAVEDGGGVSATVRLAQAMVDEVRRRVADGANPEALKTGLDRAVEAITGELGAVAESVTTKEQLAAVATTTLLRRPPGRPTDPPPDPDAAVRLGDLIAEAIDKVGVDGAITVTENNDAGHELELAEGLRFGNGLLSPYFATDPERMEAVLDHPYVLLADTALASVDDLVPLLEQVIRSSRPLLVVAEDVVGEALALLIVNKIRGVLAAVAVKVPGQGLRRAAILQDLAILTDGLQIGAVRHAELDQLGQARQAIVGREHTTIVDGSGDPGMISARVREIRSELERPLLDRERVNLEKRLAGLIDGVAVIKVGALTDYEVNEQRSGIEEAVRAVRAAVREGVVQGDAAALLQVGDAAIGRLSLTGDEVAGADAVRVAISALDPTSGCSGVIAPGIVPVGAISSELRNAASVAGTILEAGGLLLTDWSPPKE